MTESVPGVETVLADLERKARLTRRRATLSLVSLSVAGVVLLSAIFYLASRELSTLADLRRQSGEETKTIDEKTKTIERLQKQQGELEAAIRGLAPPARAPDEAPPGRQAATLPRRVYIHIADERQRPKASELSNALYRNDFVPPGIERVSNAPDRTVVKFFRPDERAGAEQIVAIMHSVGVDGNVQYLAGYADRVRPGHFEVWFGKQQ